MNDSLAKWICGPTGSRRCDERSGEAVKAYVVRRDPTLDAEAIRQWCRERLTPYKVPHYVEFREELPKTQVGKILRRALREEAWRQG